MQISSEKCKQTKLRLCSVVNLVLLSLKLPKNWVKLFQLQRTEKIKVSARTSCSLTSGEKIDYKLQVSASHSVSLKTIHSSRCSTLIILDVNEVEMNSEAAVMTHHLPLCWLWNLINLFVFLFAFHVSTKFIKNSRWKQRHWSF